MAAKKSKKNFHNNPFKNLKGLSVLPPEKKSPPAPNSSRKTELEPEEDFSSAMESLGVREISGKDRVAPRPAPGPEAPQPVPEVTPASEEEEFLAALGTLDVRFRDELPEDVPVSTARRMKQVRRGQLRVDRTLDLHGLTREQAVEKFQHFLVDAVYQGWKTVCIVTGRGLHSAEGPVLRDALEDLLRRKRPASVLEWSRAPRNLGGEGALILFLRS